MSNSEGSESGQTETMIERAITLADQFPALAAHGARVSLVATQIIDRIRLEALDLRHLTLATAHLHDIGKLALSSEILEKPGRLTPEERAHIQHHAAIGSNLLGGLGFPEELAMAVRHHHEWWNGNGYPDNRSGSDIPLPSRVIAVADAFDAMTSDRPYRRALSNDIALQELVRCSGTQFDPEVVTVLIEVWPHLANHPNSTEPRTISADNGQPA